MFKHDLSIIDTILERVTLIEWFTESKGIVKFHKSQLTSECLIDDSLHGCLQYMNAHGLSFLALINQERSMLQGFISFCEITKFLVENY